MRKTRVVPFECVARGYLAGSGFREYRAGGAVCGNPLPAGLRRADRLPAPIFTPATKAEEGHDENVDFAALAAGVGDELAGRLRDLTLELYRQGAAHAADRDLILADTKFEFGRAGGQSADGELLLIDEALTPDSSRYWEAATWRPGEEPVSFDKQFVRDWLDRERLGPREPAPELPPDVVAGTRERYVEAFRRLTGPERSSQPGFLTGLLLRRQICPPPRVWRRAAPRRAGVSSGATWRTASRTTVANPGGAPGARTSRVSCGIGTRSKGRNISGAGAASRRTSRRSPETPTTV